MHASVEPITHSLFGSGSSPNKMVPYSSHRDNGMRHVLPELPNHCITKAKKATHHVGDAARKGFARRRAGVGQLPMVVRALIRGD